MDLGGGWGLELDIRSFFDTVDHGVLRRILRERVNDGVLLRLIGKWLNAGVLEQGCVYLRLSTTYQYQTPDTLRGVHRAAA